MLYVFEGVDGSGKSTQARLLAGVLRESRGSDVLLVREPGGTLLGERVRDLVLSPEMGELAPETELFLFMAARSHLVRSRILPALAGGQTVISDRFLWSSAVYQGTAGGLDTEEILRMGELALHGVEVSRTFVIDLDPEVALRRVREPDRMEKRGLEFQKRVRDGFLALAGAFPEKTSIIDGRGSPEEVLERVLHALEARGAPS
jgi:dTMP kinase